MKEKWTIDSWEEFREALKHMSSQSKLFQTIKNELTRRGHWKPKARGKVFEKGHDPRRGRLQQ